MVRDGWPAIEGDWMETIRTNPSIGADALRELAELNDPELNAY